MNEISFTTAVGERQWSPYNLEEFLNILFYGSVNFRWLIFFSIIGLFLSSHLTLFFCSALGFIILFKQLETSLNRRFFFSLSLSSISLGGDHSRACGNIKNNFCAVCRGTYGRTTATLLGEASEPFLLSRSRARRPNQCRCRIEQAKNIDSNRDHDRMEENVLECWRTYRKKSWLSSNGDWKFVNFEILVINQRSTKNH